MASLFDYKSFIDSILDKLFDSLFREYEKRDSFEYKLLVLWKDNKAEMLKREAHIPIIIPLSYFVFIKDKILFDLEQQENIELDKNIIEPKIRDFFIWDTLGEEFCKLDLDQSPAQDEKSPVRKYLEKLLQAFTEYGAGRMDKDIYDYLVSEAILELVKHLLLKLNFTDGLAYDLLKAWQSYEELLYTQKKFYREHFIHQFQDFLLGCLFLGRLWDQFSVYYDKRRFLRRWFFASMFHDIGYPAETLGALKNTLNDKVFNKVPNYAIKHIDLETFNSDENLPHLIKNLALIHLFSENINIHESNDTSIDKFKYPINEIINLLKDELTQSQDHGVVGALFFLKTALIDLREVVVDPSTFHLTTIFTEYEPYPHLIDDLFVSAAAIAGHNLRTKVYPSYTVDFSSRPIAALLNFCDDLQEWDRRFLNPPEIETIYKNFNNENSFISKWDVGTIYPLSIQIKNEKEIEIGFTRLKDSPKDTDNLKRFNKSIKQLFETNLGDLNASFFKKLTIKGICPENSAANNKGELIELEKDSIIIELITRSYDLKAYSHMIGRYLINPKRLKKSIEGNK